MSSNNDSPKIGQGHAAAMGRQGLKELRAVFYPESNVAQPTEFGMYGTKTQGEIADAREVGGREEEERANAPPPSPEPQAPEAEPPSQEHERE